MKYIYDISENNGYKENIKIGKKAQNLNDLLKNGFNVPYFFVISNEYFEKIIFSKINKSLNIYDWNDVINNNNSKNLLQKIKDIIEDHTFENEFLKELDSYLKNDEYYAVRSSSIEEDSDSFSFAGQFETFLYIKKEEVLQNIKKIWISSFSDHIMKYRKEQKINNKINVPAIIVQKMVNSKKSGIAFSANPVNQNKNEIVISATFGLGNSLVDGIESGDLFVLDKNFKILSKKIKEKTVKQNFDYDKKTIKLEKISDSSEVLNENELKKLTENIIKIENFYSLPQDIEWAYENDSLYILQSRPITTFKTNNNQILNDSNTIIWDNGNVIESFPEITLPLTFSFAKNAYTEVYKQFAEIIGVSKKIINYYNPVFDNMLGILNGRIYNNLINWYKMLLLVPNAKKNNTFMEQMLGVTDELKGINFEENLTDAYKNMNSFEKFLSFTKKIKAGFFLFLNMFFINYRAKKFCQMIEENTKNNEEKIAKMNISELKNYYDLLENKLLKKWNVSISNDFLVMVWFGISKKLTDKFIKTNADEIHNILISQKGKDIISVEPAKYIEKLSFLLKKDTTLQEEVKNIITEKKDIFTKNSKFNELLNEYLDKFGNRAIYELKLESLTLKENPIFLLEMIYSLSLKNNENSKEETDISTEQKNIYKNIKINIFKKFLLKISIFYAQKFIKIREKLRFQRTIVFALAKNIFKQIGIYLKNSNIINNERDIFYMTTNEIFGLINASIIDTNIKKIIEIRKKNYDIYKQLTPLPNRFLTKGFIGENFFFQDLTSSEIIQHDEKKNLFKGTPCSKGIVRGFIKVIANPANEKIEKDDIVVTKSTDPSWVMVFPLLKGLIVEVGSLLSHSAIISRELGIPSIVGVSNATQLLKTGDYIEFDGSTGIIHKIEVKKTFEE